MRGRGGVGSSGANRPGLGDWIALFIGFPIMVIGYLLYLFYLGLKWLWPIVKPFLISLLQFLGYLLLSGIQRLGKLIKPKQREVVLVAPEIASDNEDNIEELLAKEIQEMKADWSLPVIKEGYPRGHLAEIQAGVLETVIASLKGRFKAKAIMKHRDTVIEMLEQQELLAKTDINRHRAIFDRILLKEDLGYELKERRKEHELKIIKKDYEIFKTKKQIEELMEEEEPEEVEVVDEEEELYQEVEREVGRKAKQEIFKHRIRSEGVEEMLREMRKRMEEIDMKPDLEEGDKERLKDELEQETEYAIKEFYERRLNEQ